MRILFAFTTPYPPDSIAGTHLGTHSVALALQRRGVAVAVAARAVTDSVGAGARAQSSFGSAGYSDEVMGYTTFRLHRPYADIGTVAKAFDASAIITHNLFPLARAAIFAAYPTVLRIHHCELVGLFGQLGPPWYDIARLPIGYTAVSQFVSEFWEKILDVRIPVVHSAIEGGTYRAATTREKLLFVNPNPLKGLDIALKLAEARPDIPFEVLESWPLSDADFTALSEQCKALPNVSLRRSVKDMRSVYATTKLLLVPSRWLEASARVVTEAQLSGIPVLASRRGGLPENVGAGGIVADPDGDFEEWKRALSLLWDDPVVYARYSEAALAHSARIEIQPDYIAEQLLGIAARQIKVHERHLSAASEAAQ